MIFKDIIHQVSYISKYEFSEEKVNNKLKFDIERLIQGKRQKSFL